MTVHEMNESVAENVKVLYCRHLIYWGGESSAVCWQLNPDPGISEEKIDGKEKIDDFS